MADTEQNLDNRMWRIEQQQRDIFLRLDKLDGRVEEIERRQGDRMYRTETLEHRVAEIEKKPPAASGGMGDSLMRTIVYGLIAGIVALASGQAINFTGLLK